MTLYSGPIGDRGRIPFPELQNVTNLDRLPRRSILEGWPVYRRMAEIDDIVTYTPADDQEECKMERSFDDDILDVLYFEKSRRATQPHFLYRDGLTSDHNLFA